ncbi:MAG: tetratricopeptide repeat protein [Spirochaetaceae bacterium]|nr:MAG: tetratricopeptide repeat protein [Spirochaetaceae bacterium]
MIYSTDKRSTSKTSRSRNSETSPTSHGGAKRPRILVWLAGLGGAVLIAAGAFFVFGGEVPTVGNRTGIDRGEIETLWDRREFFELIRLTDDLLAADPLDVDALIFRGLAGYYGAASDIDLENRDELIRDSIRYLRRARTLSGERLSAEIHFVLGLAYYEQGRHFADLAVDHLNQAVELGVDNASVYEFLGLSYERLYDRDRAINNLLLAADRAPRDISFLAVAERLVENNQASEALPHLHRVISESDEPRLVHQARFILGQIELSEARYEQAEEQFQAVLQDDPNSADAHFYLGELFDAMGDGVRARAQWRNALQIDSGHAAALRRLDS